MSALDSSRPKVSAAEASKALQGRPASPPPAPRLARVIGSGGLAFLIVNCVVGSGIFGLPGLVAAALGSAALVAYLVCAALVCLVGLCLAESGSRVCGAGGLYAYARASFGPVIGGVTGTLVWGANSMIASAAVANLLAATIQATIPALEGPIVRGSIILLTYAILAGINIRGARAGMTFSAALAVMKLVPLAGLVFLGWPHVHTANLHWSSVPTAHEIGAASVLVFFAFLGTESALTASGEVISPARSVPRAIGFALTGITLLYINIQIVSQGVLGTQLANSKVPLIDVASSIVGRQAADVMIAATLLSVLGYLSGDMLSSPRILHALAQAGQLPHALMHVQVRSGTPAVAIVSYAILCAIIACTGSFHRLVVLGSSGTLLLYLICCVGLLRLRARHVAMDGAPFSAPGGALVPLAACGIIVWMLSTLKAEELATTATLVGVSAAVYSLQEYRRNKTTAVLPPTDPPSR